MNGTELAARYSLNPAQLGICSQKRGDFVALRDYVEEPSPEKEGAARSVLESFPVVYPYLALIARANGIADTFDKKAVEAYFIGNELTARVPFSATVKMVRSSFPKIGHLSEQEVGARIRRLNRRFRPHHNFHVFCLGSVTGNVDYSNPDIAPLVLGMCQISWGKVTRATKGEIIVANMPVLAQGRRGFQIISEEGEARLGREAAAGLPIAPGKLVTLHWQNICQIISKKQLSTLRTYTLEALAVSGLWGEE